jgi:hypothetical protein
VLSASYPEIPLLPTVNRQLSHYNNMKLEYPCGSTQTLPGILSFQSSIRFHITLVAVRSLHPQERYVLPGADCREADNCSAVLPDHVLCLMSLAPLSGRGNSFTPARKVSLPLRQLFPQRACRTALCKQRLLVLIRTHTQAGIWTDGRTEFTREALFSEFLRNA